MKKYSLTIMLFFTSMVNADVPSESQHEVQHLISFVRNTSCQIDRNWTNHNGLEAIAHIQQKYAYYKDDISTTEQFIEYSASKSTMTGMDYLVKCADQSPVKTRGWLLQELQRYRAQRKSKLDVKEKL